MMNRFGEKKIILVQGLIISLKTEEVLQGYVDQQWQKVAERGF
jgi:hypothetical protein